jgi:uncharacterized protein YaaW (UPF0174 family)
MEATYVDKVKEWVELDSKALELKTSINDLNEKKKELEEEIIEYVEKNNLENISLNITDGRLKFPKTTIKQSLSMKYLKTTLGKYNEEHASSAQIDVDALCQYLVDNLETTTKVTIKRMVR